MLISLKTGGYVINKKMPNKAAIHKKSTKSTKTKSRAKTALKKKKASVKATKNVSASTPVVTPVVATPPPPSKRSAPTRETVLADFEELIESVNASIKDLREGPTKTKGVKLLRSINKKIKALRSKTARVMRQKRKTGRTNNKNSGFLKPVSISSEMAKFTGWNPDTLRSRVDVTKYICDYIKEHDLQNPEDRRQIKPDRKLQKLLSYNPKKAKEPLRYYSLQTHLKQHFPKKE